VVNRRIAWPQLRLASAGGLWQSTMSIATGLLLLLAFPRFSLSLLAWVALAPLLYTVTSGIELRRALWLGWLSGMFFTFFSENWIAHSMTMYGGLMTAAAYFVALLFAAVLAVFPALFAVAMAQLMRSFGLWSIAAAPAVWVATEWFRPVVTGVTWNALGVSQFEHYNVAVLAQYGGVFLVSWELAASSALLVSILRARERPARQTAALMVVFLLIPLLLPAPARLRTEADQLPRAATLGTPVTVVGVQPNIELARADDPNDFNRNFERVRALTKEGIARGPGGRSDLVIWAESPLALAYENDPTMRDLVDATAKEAGAYLITNSITREGNQYFNSVHVINPKQPDSSSAVPLRRYDKMRLVPFGEYVPWRPLLGRLVPAIVGDFTPGSKAVVNVLKLEERRAGLAVGATQEEPEYRIERETRLVRIGTFICYEAAYPNLVRQFVNGGATLLVNVSDDAWFGDTAGADQHLAHAVMRAIENDRDLVRVTNSGVTALITAEGHVVDSLERSTAAAGVWQAVPRAGRTFYTRQGDLFAIACVVLSTLVVGMGVVVSRRAPDRR
jgi:apolipoprotein N-acyltransferase